MKNGIAIRTKWLTPCHRVVGTVERGIGVGANHSPTMLEQISTIAIGRRKKNSAKNTMMTYERLPINQPPKPVLGGSGSRPLSLPTSSASVCAIINAPAIGTG